MKIKFCELHNTVCIYKWDENGKIKIKYMYKLRNEIRSIVNIGGPLSVHNLIKI